MFVEGLVLVTLLFTLHRWIKAGYIKAVRAVGSKYGETPYSRVPVP